MAILWIQEKMQDDGRAEQGNRLENFTANAGTDTITFGELADFVEGQAVRLFTTI